MKRKSENSCALTTGKVEELLKLYSPDYIYCHCKGLTQAEISTLCFFSETPTLSELKAAHGANIPTAWLLAQLYRVSEFCGAKEKMPVEVAERTAFIIYASYYYLKLTELILFFYQFSTGKYGRFYGTTDPQIILNALATFVCKERNPALERHENEEALKQRMQESTHAVKREDYLRQIRIDATKGDKTAQLLCDINHINYGSQEDIH